MANAKTGIWSAVGALLGGAAGAAAGYYTAKLRPTRRSRAHAQDIEDAMVIGGATGATLGAFIAGTTTGEEAATAQLKP